jgi:hypothetical protein
MTRITVITVKLLIMEADLRTSLASSLAASTLSMETSYSKTRFFSVPSVLHSVSRYLKHLVAVSRKEMNPQLALQHRLAPPLDTQNMDTSFLSVLPVELIVDTLDTLDFYTLLVCRQVHITWHRSALLRLTLDSGLPPLSYFDRRHG